MRLAPALFAFLFLQAGCVVAPPRYDNADPLANFGTGAAKTSPYANLTIGVIFTNNTRLSLMSLASNRDLARAKDANLNRAVIAELDPEGAGDKLSRLFSARFKDVRMAESPEAAREKGCDLVAAVDLKVHLTQAAPGTTSVELSASFADLRGAPLGVFSGTGTVKLGWFSMGTFGFADSYAQALAGVAGSLDRSESLGAFAANKPGAKAPAAEPASVSFVSDVDRPTFKIRERLDDFAVVVGVERYSNDLPAALFAERDARAVKDHLVSLGYPERNIKLLTGSRAVRSSLEAYLEDWLPRNIKDDSRVFFYFSGHGAPDTASGQAYLVPWDGDPNFLNKTAFPLKKLYSDLNALRAKSVVVALDSCFSGAGGRSVLSEGARPLVGRVDTAIDPGGKIVLFAAASAREITSVLKEQGHGMFTYYFLKGLDDAAQAKDSKGLSARSLYEYLKPKVQDAASRQNRDQTPVLDGLTNLEIARFANE